MRINADSPVLAAEATAATRAGRALDPVSGVAGGDRLEISGRAREVAIAREAIQQLPPVRAARVASLRDAIQSGRYNVPAEAVAARILAGNGWG
ncbi:MAG TPA: flagellar biosynthesis anti-sigma factor FlgM [Armatimonadota bacterium]|jgi:flagellar biosynthesis anti-sigma factor FlgM|nr:flagellar biosynthesis anti-sigma factor FlgM [Armatimonadota bacterium]HOM82632.1 flagellar biosynthesis anti-sigma factor FlgM [Armatimonadota bacterium]HOQ27282.1 flagellar biosynthesis anti-sigma factor FlgM [Armatimonadota bacterium]HPO72127.1 flagellar biosynthesis anti-sigma factor FlgM [Armatimonadota bacterium]HPT96938.1 flagellar biosynthesis anti-sigma factor FlgM [Armatimonadota bacterium]